MSRTKLIVGTRASRLAVIQTGTVVNRLKETNPGLDISVETIVTEGDRNRHLALGQVDSVGMFIKELEKALMEGQIDIAVHSLKDVPTEITPDFALLATIERHDPRDVLVAKARLTELPPHARIGTGSLRRSVQLAQFRPDLDIVSIRGNVTTRVGKVTSGEYDGVMLAAAAMWRLGWLDRVTEFLPLEQFLPCVGQGALVIEGRANDPEVHEICARVNHAATWHSVAAERAFLLALGGGCRAPIAALGNITDGVLRLDGMIASIDGKKVVRASAAGSPEAAAEIGRKLAQKLLALGGAQLIQQAKGK